MDTRQQWPDLLSTGQQRLELWDSGSSHHLKEKGGEGIDYSTESNENFTVNIAFMNTQDHHRGQTSINSEIWQKITVYNLLPPLSGLLFKTSWIDIALQTWVFVHTSMGTCMYTSIHVECLVTLQFRQSARKGSEAASYKTPYTALKSGFLHREHRHVDEANLHSFCLCLSPYEVEMGMSSFLTEVFANAWTMSWWWKALNALGVRC